MRGDCIAKGPERGFGCGDEAAGDSDREFFEAEPAAAGELDAEAEFGDDELALGFEGETVRAGEEVEGFV